MEFIKRIFQIASQFDNYLFDLIQICGKWIYLLLFFMFFFEAVFLLAPLLPGESLLFVAGALAASKSLKLWIVAVVLILGAVAGDNVNYYIGRFIGDRLAREKKILFIKKEHLEKTLNIVRRHNGLTMLFARFIPFARTLAPLAAGMVNTTYKRFLMYNIVGGTARIIIYLLLGYFFGTAFNGKATFLPLLTGIVIVSVLPGIVGYFVQRTKAMAGK